MSNRMALVDPYLDDVEQCSGNRPTSFVCPILLEESAGVELIDGHILPQRLKTAARATVLQRKDVDNFFGHTIEPPLIEFLNSITHNKANFLEQAKGIQIVSVNAGPLDLFVPNRKSNPPFPKLRFQDSKGVTIASRHVKGTLANLGGKEGLAEVRGSMSFHKPSLDGALLKSPHLALFRIAGYRWAFSAPGRYIGTTLKQFFRTAGEQSDAEALFAEFAAAFHVILNDTFSFNTLTDSTVLLHDYLDDPHSVDPFAISCVFAVNDRTILVTLPFCSGDCDFPARLDDYRRLLSDWQLNHRIIRATLSKDGIKPESIIQMKYTENPPQELIRPIRCEEE